MRRIEPSVSISDPKEMRNLLLMSLCWVCVACSKVPAGHVGIKFYLLGGEKGVDTEELGPGRYWIGVNEDLYLFPTFTQNYTWTKPAADSRDSDESITFQTDQGLSVNADVGISYAVDPSKVTTLFQKYRKGIQEITDVYLRNMVRDALVTEASTRQIETVYGAGKAELLAAVEKRVRAQVEPLGINLERLYWAGEFRLPATVTNAIDAKIKATQFAQQRANEVAAAKAEADKAIEEARGVAESTLLKAKAEAEAIRIKGDALRENPRLVELSAIEKWNGTMPQFVGGGAMPFISIPQTK
jgi:regulator of protease activity HflC (stomatin/prohibitin superfamily)